MSETLLSVKWIRYSESQWYPHAYQGGACLKSGWRCALYVPNHLLLDAFSIDGFTCHVKDKEHIVVWPKLNQGEYWYKHEDAQWTLLPTQVEPDECLLRLTTHRYQETEDIELFVEDEPAELLDADVFNLQLAWVEGKATLKADIDITTELRWHVYRYGQWVSHLITSLDSGLYDIVLDPPLGDIVYLQSTGYGRYTHIHRMNVVGRPGIASGRYLWNRGTLYSPRMPKALPWVSVVIPVHHLSDIERFPKYHRWDQLEWWIEESSWAEEAQALIHEHFPKSSIVQMGGLDSKQADIIVLQPYQMQSATLDRSKIYTVYPFDNTGDSNFGRRAAWILTKLQDDDFQEFQFVENNWRSAYLSVTNPEAHPVYGFSYSFTRSTEHEHLWSGAVRNIFLREDKESLPCASCVAKASCKQLLSSSYQPPDGIVIPWRSLTSHECVVVKWFN